MPLCTPLYVTLQSSVPFHIPLCTTLLCSSAFISVSFCMPPWPFVSLHTPMHALYSPRLSLCYSTPLCAPLSFARHPPCLSVLPCILLCVALCATLHHLCDLHSSLNSFIPFSIPLLSISMSLCTHCTNLFATLYPSTPLSVLLCTPFMPLQTLLVLPL